MQRLCKERLKLRDTSNMKATPARSRVTQVHKRPLNALLLPCCTSAHPNRLPNQLNERDFRRCSVLEFGSELFQYFKGNYQNDRKA